ncbi:hypothetical protein GGR53DRAFT_235544 [Hypoxylon sp. FL1150]|nr:hypothetical protein GGR53DRAFT_235544 [Hypoxylon sp. FL1150]
MSFGFGVGDFIAAFELVNKLRKGFAGAPDQFQQISNELKIFDDALRNTDVSLSVHDISPDQKQSLNDIDRNCHLILTDAQSMLDKYSALESQGGFRRGAKRVWGRLRWDLKDVNDLRSWITFSTTSLSSFIGRLTADNVVNLAKGQEKLVRRQDQQEHQEILDWLTPNDYSAQQSDFIRRRQEGTGQWLLDSPEYQRWVSVKKEALFCPGIPGAGKTILTSIVVENLCNLYHADPSVGICYVYCNYRQKDEQKLDNLIASLLRQLLQTQLVIPGSVKILHERFKERRMSPSLDELFKALHSVIIAYSKVFVVIDALDECQASDACRSTFISELLNLRSDFGANIFATSRSIPEITSNFHDAMHKEIRAHEDDIERYLLSNISRLPGFVSRDTKIQAEIKESIIKNVDGMFLLAQLHLHSLRGKRSRKAVREALSNLARGSDAYDTAYNDAMERIKCQLSDQRDLAFQALSWVTYARRPLTTVEVRHALAVELDEPEFDEDNLPDLEDVMSACCGLLTVAEQTNIIRLVHYTTQEYFERTRTVWFPNAQSDILRVCVTYLSFNAFESGSCATDSEFEERLALYPLFDYASQYWGNHAYSVPNYQDYYTFLSMDTKVNASSQALFDDVRLTRLECAWKQESRYFTGLHLAAYFGLYEATKFLLECHNSMGVDDDGTMPGYKYKHGKTPLIYACENGHEAVVRLLLENGAELDFEDASGTLLAHAALGGHEAVVEVLIQKGADIDSIATRPYDIGMTPLMFAAESGNEAIVRLLLEKGAEINTKVTISGKTPLMFAAKSGNEAIVRLLLEKGAKIHISQNWLFSMGIKP